MGRELLIGALQNLTAHRLRSVLSIVGIVAGVATVVSVLSIAEGAKARAMADIGALGVDNIRVQAVSPSAASDPRSKRQAPILTLGDRTALRGLFASATVAARRSVPDDIVSSDTRVAGIVDGVTKDWLAADSVSVPRGRWFDDEDDKARVAVVGRSLASALFGAADPIGRRVLAAGEFRVVIGVTTRDQALFVPIGSLDVSTGEGDAGDAVDEIVAHLPPRADPSSRAAAVSTLLASRHDPTSFEVVVPQELLRAKLRAERAAQALMLGVGVVAMLISGIGITNIMVASVAERGPEIGLRRAVGARRREIVAQFAVEAAVLSGAGGLVGLPIGALAAAGVAALAAWPVVLSTSSLALALGLAVAVGLCAGIYPARLAASIAPVDALAGRLAPARERPIVTSPVACT